MTAEIRFGTDGWRAVIAEDYTFENVRLCAQALSEYLLRVAAPLPSVVVGYDTRFASEDFAAATAEVLGANGIHTYLSTAAIPTPVVSHAVANLKASAGVVITASHNPARWNGFKIKGPDGSSAPVDVIASVEAAIASLVARGAGVAGAIKRQPLEELVASDVVHWYDAATPYCSAVGKLVDLEALKQMPGTVVIDSMFGAGSGFFERLVGGGALRIEEINGERNPAFPGIRPEPIGPNLERLCNRVPATGAIVGIATDGDADRVGIVDEHGGFLNQHQVFALLCHYLLAVRGERGDIVRSITTSEMLSLLGRKYNVPVHVTRVGFKYIAPLMLEYNALIGGEESGGYAFRGHVPERDGIVAGLYFLDMVRQTGKAPSALLQDVYDAVGPHYYDRVDLELEPAHRSRVADVLAHMAPDAVAGTAVARVDRTDGVMLVLVDGSWVLYRLSGTEPLVRIYVETDSRERVRELLGAGQKLLGV